MNTTDYAVETRRALLHALSRRNITPYRLARDAGISTGTVYDILNQRAVSERRLNTLRPVLGLPVIRHEVISIDPTKQKIVTRQGPTPYVSRQVRLSPADAAALDRYIAASGCNSFSQWFHRHFMDVIWLALRDA